MLNSKQFGNYQIIRKLARGMTDVYLAFDTRANRHAVLKIVEGVAPTMAPVPSVSAPVPMIVDDVLMGTEVVVGVL